MINVGDLNRFAPGTVVTPDLLKEHKLVKKLKAGVKLLAKGEIDKALTIKVHGVSEAATQKIKAAGGQVEVI